MMNTLKAILLMLVAILLGCLAATARADEPTIIDYSTTAVLRDTPGVERGYVVYHLWADQYGLDKIRTKHLPKIPNGSTVMLDFEPWVSGQNRYPWYGDATDEENMKMLSEYAWIIRELTPEFVAKDLTLATYSLPALMQRNWNAVRRGEGHPQHKAWRGRQLRVLMQAEHSGFLPALRAIDGHVLVIGYLPPQWDGERGWHAKALKQTIANMDAMLDEHDVPHRWLWKPYLTSSEPVHNDLLKIMIDRGGDWWSKEGVPGNEQLRKALQ